MPTNTLVLIETYGLIVLTRTKQVFELPLTGDRYKSQATFDRHFSTPQYAEFQAILKQENIIDFTDPVDAEIRTVKHVSGLW